MTLSSDVQIDFNRIVNTNGVPFSAQNGSNIYTAGEYDDDTTRVPIGSLIGGSCFIFPLDGKNGSDSQYIEQGLVKLEDLKAYVPSGAKILSNADFTVKGGSYWVVAQYDYTLEDLLIYQKLYLRAKVLV